MATSKDTPAEQAGKEKHKAAQKVAEKVEVEQGAAKRERGRLETPEAVASEPEQAEPKEDIGRIDELGGQEAKED